MQEQLKLYRELTEQIQALQERANTKIKVLQEQVNTIVVELQAHVGSAGNLEGHGVRAYMKAGRKSTNHEAAAAAAEVPAELIEKFSTTKVTVAWAKITKEAKVDTAPFTTEGKPSFVIEVK